MFLLLFDKNQLKLFDSYIAFLFKWLSVL